MQDYKFDENKTALFHNFSNEAFPSEHYPCSWDGRPIDPIPAGATVEMPQFLAYHTAKHLANREIFKNAESIKKDPLLNGDMHENYMRRALVGEGGSAVTETNTLKFKSIEVVAEAETTDEPEVKEVKKPVAKKGKKEAKEDINPDFEK